MAPDALGFKEELDGPTEAGTTAAASKLVQCGSGAMDSNVFDELTVDSGTMGTKKQSALIEFAAHDEPEVTQSSLAALAATLV